MSPARQAGKEQRTRSRTSAAFFRDPRAFEELGRRVLARTARESTRETPIRIWVPGCATGEDAYSIGIVLAEKLAAARSPRRVQIFATDVDEAALRVARAGAYPESIARDVTPERLARFFTRENRRYRVSTMLRECVVFAGQDLTADPPFSKLDLVRCRDLLVDVEPPLQRRLISLFHSALKPEGHLFLGSADGVDELRGLFAPLSERWQIFARLGSSTTPGVDASAPTRRDRSADKSRAEPVLETLAERQLLAHLSPAAVVIDRAGRIVHIIGPMQRYLRLPRGPSTLDLATLARGPLKPALRAALHGALGRRRRVSLEAMPVTRGRTRAVVRVAVMPLRGARRDEGLSLVVFEELPIAASSTARGAASQQRTLTRRLEAALEATQSDYQALVAQLGASNEELKAANQEVTSVNEELQSTNEELERSEEELKAVNETLSTVNAQLQEKVQELTALSDDLTNLLAATDIATVFVDANFRVSRFTFAATRLLNLIPSDVGRPIAHLASNLVDFDLPGESARVLDTLSPVERAVQARDGGHYIVRVLPYFREGRRAKGVVITLVDVTELKASEQALRTSRRFLEALARLNQDALSTSVSDEFLERFVGTVAGTLALQSVAVLEHESATGRARVRAATGRAEKAMGMLLSECPEGLTLLARQTGVFTALREDRRFVNDADLHERQLESGIGAIVWRDGEAWGVLGAFTSDRRTFTPEEIQFVEAVANTLGAALARAHAEDALRVLNQTLEQRVADRTRHLMLMHVITRAISDAPSWDEALQAVLREICRTEGWRLGYVHVPDKQSPDELVAVIGCVDSDRFLPFHEISHARRYPRASFPGRVYTEGVPIWLTDEEGLQKGLPQRWQAARHVGLRSAVGVPISIGSETVGVLELFSDLPRRVSDDLIRLMDDVGAQISRVIDRERVMSQVAEMVWSEQQGLLHTLHDSVGQQLTGLGMLSSGLSQRLRDYDPPLAGTAQQITHLAAQSLEQIRQLAKGLFPVEVDAEGLALALRQLAATTEAVSPIRCTVQEEGAVLVRDNRVATELYRIAQEGVTNALKHAQARTVSIRLSADISTTILKIADDGVGIETSPGEAGMGMRIMRYRASSIGANLLIEPGPSGGTVVTCTLREVPAPGRPAAVQVVGLV